MKGPTTNSAISHPVDLRTSEVADILGCSERKVWSEAAKHGVGYNLRGRAGWRFTEADVDKLRAAMAPPKPVKRRRVA